MDDLRVIHLKRENILRTLVSRKIAGRTDLWATRKVNEVPLVERRVHFTEDELLKGFEQTRRWENEFDSAFRSSQVSHVTYEQLTTAPHEHFRRLTRALGAEGSLGRISLKRQNPEPLAQLIGNYQELKEGFAGTEWAAFFEDP